MLNSVHRWRSLVGFSAFVPFVVLLAIHHILGLSDAMMVGPKPGETWWPAYNILMILSFYAGCGGYMVIALGNTSRKRRD